MGLPSIGPLELIIILAIALLIVGPGRLPEMGNAIGRTIREFRKASSDVSDATALEPAKATPKPAPAEQPVPSAVGSDPPSDPMPSPPAADEGGSEGDHDRDVA